MRPIFAGLFGLQKYHLAILFLLAVVLGVAFLGRRARSRKNRLVPRTCPQCGRRLPKGHVPSCGYCETKLP